MSIFGGNRQKPAQDQSGQLDPMQKIREIQQNPSATLGQAGFNLPSNMTDPNQILALMQQQARPGVVQTALRILGGKKINN